jgi:hypothetical protein
MASKKQLVTKPILKFLRCLLPASLITVVLMSGSNADTGTVIGETAAISIASSIDFNNGKLSVSCKGTPLSQVIREVSRQSGIDIQFIGEHPSSRVNIHLIDALLEKGLRLLLREENTVFIYADKEKNGVYRRQLTKVLILPEGENVNANNGIVMVTETLSGISQQIQDSIPQAYKDSNAHSSMNNPLIDQAIYELSETLSERILNSGQTPN